MDYRPIGRTGVTVSHLCLGAMMFLDEATLDRIDELVPPGTNVNPADAGWTSPALDKRARRR